MSGLGEYHNNYGESEEEYPHWPTQEELDAYQPVDYAWVGMSGGLSSEEVENLIEVYMHNPEAIDNIKILRPPEHDK